ncbi:gamma-glutamyl-gamma-aminobutyrate hydrolase family protein (plasmid) [Buchnera aphidicola (Neophyllaphis podocarpi)]|uniref:glutamine amidotransferase-related protein n=1 Tax=Buchnera aphidicola TaxID=9 RepID=UPI0031B8B252
MNEIMLIDNIDSFIYNLAEQLRNLDNKVLIYRNNVYADSIIKAISKMHNPILVLSPGPGKPSDAGCMSILLKKLKGKLPIIGICLGYQAIVESYGGITKNAKEIIHGRASLINHDKKEMFEKIPNPLLVARYHSLICDKVPDSLTINSYFEDIVMSVRNNNDKVCGFQFHPESILTPFGSQLLEETIIWTRN